MLSLNDLIQQALLDGRHGALSKIAEETSGEASSESCVDCGRPAIPGQQLCQDCAQRRLGSEQAAAATSEVEKTSSARVERLASAVDFALRNPSWVSSYVKLAEGDGPGEGAGALDMDLTAPTVGLGPASYQGSKVNAIPLTPPMESGVAGGPATAMGTDMDDTPGGTESGVTNNMGSAKVATSALGGAIAGGLLGTGVGAGVGALSAPKGQRAEGARRGALIGSATGLVGGGLTGAAAASRLARTPEEARTLQGMRELGFRAGRGDQVAQQTLQEAQKILRTPAPRERGASIAGAIIGAGGAIGGGIAAGRTVRRPDAEQVSPKVAAIHRVMLKRAQPEAESALPENRPDPMVRPAEATSQMKLLATNEAAINFTPRDAAVVPKKQMGEMLDEPMQSALGDSALKDQLGAALVNEAGAKVASARQTVASLLKVAGEGCSCGSHGTCTFCKVASLAERKRARQAGVGNAVVPTRGR